MNEEMSVDFSGIFRNVEYLIQKGKGYSIYNAHNDIHDKISNEFMEVLKIEIKSIRISNFVYKDEIYQKIPIIIYQDLEYLDFLEKADEVVNRLIYPAWYNGCTIIFISKIDKSYYKVNEIQSSLIHTNYKDILNLLSMEQMNNLLDLVNVNITSPKMINDFDDKVLYTPIEKIFKNKLIENNISFTPQVKLGRFFVDFLLEINKKKIIVECDGRDYHNPYRDQERDKEINKEGYKIFRFSGSKIFNDCNSCLDEIIRYSHTIINSKFVLEELNDEQNLAVNHITGPMRVLAPAGSGKTKTLVNRIVNLVNFDVDESEILALAFNKKAEIEMNERLNGKFGLSKVDIKTFHSFGNSIIAKTLKWRFNGDNQDKVTRELLGKAIRKHEKIVYQRNKDPMDKYLNMLSKVKNDLIPIEEMFIESETQSINFEPIFNDYIKYTFEYNFYNYDDMLYIAVRQLLSDPILRKRVQNKYKYILVDEFQDLNKLQLLLLQILALPENNLFIVGDDDQMIYGFRGAEIRHILEFDKRYAINTDQVLKINYRSCSNIVRHSKWLIDHNKLRASKDITSFSEEKGEIKLFIGISLVDQAEKIAQWIIEHKNENTKWSDFAILFRNNQYRDLLYMILSANKIPVDFDRIKILNSNVGRCIFAYLIILIDPKQTKTEHYEEILKKPNKYFTNEFISTIGNWDDFNDLDAAKKILRKMDVDRYIHLLNKIKSLSSDIDGKPAVSIINAIVEEFDLKQFYKDESRMTSEIDAASDYDIIEIITSFSEGYETVGDFYNYWINHLEKDIVETDEKNNDKVSLTTIHKTKGNEYKNVAYFNLVNRETKTESELEEERRVSYVGVTRPKMALIITTQKDEISPFVREFFLNPRYYSLREEALKNQILTLDAEANILKVNIQGIEEDIRELNVKYPELNGEYTSTRGIFKKLRQELRKKTVKFAFEKMKKFNEQRNGFDKKRTLLIGEKGNIESELEYRGILDRCGDVKK